MLKEQKNVREETDKRLMENKLMRGHLSEKKLQEYLATLPDLSANAEEVDVVIEERK